jgi:hypothetical protein
MPGKSVVVSSACREADWQAGGVHDLAAAYTSDGAKNADVASGDVGVFVFGLHRRETGKAHNLQDRGE